MGAYENRICNCLINLRRVAYDRGKSRWKEQGIWRIDGELGLLEHGSARSYLNPWKIPIRLGARMDGEKYQSDKRYMREHGRHLDSFNNSTTRFRSSANAPWARPRLKILPQEPTK